MNKTTNLGMLKSGAATERAGARGDHWPAGLDDALDLIDAAIGQLEPSGGLSLPAPKEIALAPGAPGNFTVAHGLAQAPKLVLIQMTAGGQIWFQTTRYDATNLYLVASDGGITGNAEAWL